MKEQKKYNRRRKEILPENIWNENNKDKIKEFIEEHLNKQTPEQRLNTRLKAIQFKMEDYIEQNENNKIIEIDDFVEEFLKLFRIPKLEFARILGMNYANLYKYLNGERKLNPDLVLKISSFSHTKPEIWLFIEAKNNILELRKNEKEIEKYDRYKFENYLFSSSK